MFILILTTFFCIGGCSKKTTNINIKGIYLNSTNANNNNVYDIKFLMIEILDFETNKDFIVYNDNNLSYKIDKPKPFVVESDYLLPNKQSIVSITSTQFKLVVTLTIIYNGKEISFCENGTININYTSDNQLNLKNTDYNPILASLLNFTFDLKNDQKEQISLILNVEQIKN